MQQPQGVCAAVHALNQTAFGRPNQGPGLNEFRAFTFLAKCAILSSQIKMIKFGSNEGNLAKKEYIRRKR